MNPSVEPLRLLAIYRGKLDENRGTPIRVRSFLERLSKDARFSLTVASWDASLPFAAEHVRLTNKKRADARSILAIVKEKHIDLVMGHTMATWYYLLLVKLFTRAKIALEMHGFIEVEAHFYGSIGVVRYTLDRLIYGIFYRMCDLITTCSENAAEILLHYNRNVFPIYGGVDTDMFHPDIAPLPSVHHDAGVTLIGYAGNMRKWQGVPFMMEAFKKLHAKDPSFRLAILSSEAKNLPSEEGADIYGQVPHEEVPAFLAACDVLVIPRLSDAVSDISFPSKLPEYLAMGKVVVASSTSDAHRAIADGVDGRIFSPGDEAAFLEILSRLKDPEVRRRIGEAARKTAVVRFQWNTQTAILAERLLALA